MTLEPLHAALRILAGHAPAVCDGRVDWALTGGLACQLHLRTANAADWFRPTKDIDIYAFSDRLGAIPLSCWEVIAIRDGDVTPLPPFGPFSAPATIADVWHGYHFDNVVPGPEDVCEVACDGGTIPALRPEFLFVFKTLCCFFRRPKDDFDATGLLTAVPFGRNRFADVIARSPFRPHLPARVAPEDLCDAGFRQQLAARLLSRTLDPAQAELVAALPADMLFPLVLTERDRAVGLTPAMLRRCVLEHRIKQLSEEEQALGLLLACWSEPAPTMQALCETQELLYEAVYLRKARFDLDMFFSFAALWGRYMQPLMHTPHAPKLKAGILQSNMRGALMTQAGAAADALRSHDTAAGLLGS